jgi:hypothetical protein
LDALGEIDKPLIIKKDIRVTIEKLLNSTEYIKIKTIKNYYHVKNNSEYLKRCIATLLSLMPYRL